jgi:hypothetical protein
MTDSFEALVKRAKGYGIEFEYNHRRVNQFFVTYRNCEWHRRNPAEVKLLLDALLDLASTLQLDEFVDRLHTYNIKETKDGTDKATT